MVHSALIIAVWICDTIVLSEHNNFDESYNSQSEAQSKMYGWLTHNFWVTFFLMTKYLQFGRHCFLKQCPIEDSKKELYLGLELGNEIIR